MPSVSEFTSNETMGHSTDRMCATFAVSRREQVTQFLCFTCIRLVFRPHRSTTNVDAAYCYRLSRLVCLSVCLSVTVMSPEKTAELIEMPFGLWDQIEPREHVLDGVHIGATC